MEIQFCRLRIIWDETLRYVISWKKIFTNTLNDWLFRMYIVDWKVNNNFAMGNSIFLLPNLRSQFVKACSFLCAHIFWIKWRIATELQIRLFLMQNSIICTLLFKGITCKTSLKSPQKRIILTSMGISPKKGFC